MSTQSDITTNMIQQLRLLDPSVSAEVGTPERKIIDTVSQELANAQIDLFQLNGAFDLDSKFGADLDNFLSIFGFARQQGSQSIGYVTFSRNVASNYTVPVPLGTQILANSVTTDGGLTLALTYATTAYAELAPGSTSVIVPIRCLSIGTIGNVAANTINSFARTPIIGITTVTNDVPTTGGTDVEGDAAFKVRFKNTVFRNLAGTLDQYLALAISTQFTTKANAVGPISRYQEYIQVPDVDDATIDPDSGVGGNGAAGAWTSALSDIPYSKHIYDTLPYFLTGGDGSTGLTFFRQDVDFQINITNTGRDRGDTYRGRIEGSGFNVNTDAGSTYQPNLTFYNVYTGADSTVTALRPDDIVLFEHAYMSDASRNDYDRQLLNCVDVFINGSNPTLADAITVKPNSTFATNNQFVTNTANRFYFDNFRRVGEPERRPVPGNFVLGLFWTPILDLPDTIVTSNATYLKNVHYWAIEDVSDIGRSIRARTGIEFNPTMLGQIGSDDVNGPFNGNTIIADSDTSLTITGYTYDKNIVDLQNTLESSKQITTDVLAHQSKNRYFKLDLTVMYTTGSTIASVNSNIRAAIANYFDGQYFGTTIQLSDILQVIHNLSGVDNVRWSRDLTEKVAPYPNDTDAVGNPRNRLVEVDIDGNPLCNLLIDRRTYGTASAKEVQIAYFTGNPVSGTFKLSYQATTTGTISFGATASDIQTACTSASIPVTVTGSGTPVSPFIFTFTANGYRDLFIVTSNELRGSTAISDTTVFDTDFFLKDDELPALPTGTLSSDTLAGVIIRKKAQNTWGQL